MSETIMNALVELMLSVVFLLISTIIIPALSGWIKSKTENEKFKTVIDDITQTVQTSVGMLEQTMVKQLKKDGNWNCDTQKKVLEAAVLEVMGNLTSTTHNILLEENGDVKAVVTRYIESYIQSQKIPDISFVED